MHCSTLIAAIALFSIGQVASRPTLLSGSLPLLGGEESSSDYSAQPSSRTGSSAYGATSPTNGGLLSGVTNGSLLDAVSRGNPGASTDIIEGVTKSLPLGSVSNILPINSVTNMLPLNSASSMLPLSSVTNALPLNSVSSMIPLKSVSNVIPLSSVTNAVPLHSVTNMLLPNSVDNLPPANGLMGSSGVTKPNASQYA